MQMIRSKRAIWSLNDELSKATAPAAAATELVDRKRKAAAATEDDLNSFAGLTRSCYGTEAAADVSSNTALSAASPVY
jgi:hypothetical protein